MAEELNGEPGEAGELEPEVPKLSKGIRRALAAAAEENADVLANRLLELSKAEKEKWETCPKCQHRLVVRMPDSSAATNAIKVLLEQGKAKEEEREVRAPSVADDRPFSEMTNAELIAAMGDNGPLGSPTRAHAAYVALGSAVDALLAGSGSKQKLGRAWREWGDVTGNILLAVEPVPAGEQA